MKRYGNVRVLAVLALAVVLTMGMQVVAAAEESVTSREPAVVELTLEDAIRLALDNGATVKTARLDERLAEIALMELRAQGDENVSAETMQAREKAYKDAQEAVIEAMKSTAISVEKSYYSMMKALQRVASAERSLEAKVLQLEVVSLKFDAGIEPKSALDAAQEGVKTAEKQLASAKFALETEQIRFNSSLGLDLAAKVVLVDEFPYKPVEITLEESIAYALENRDDIQTRVLAVEEAKKSLERTEQIPGHTKIDIEKANISLAKAEMQLASTRTNAMVAVRGAYASLQTAADNVESAMESLRKAEEALEKAKARYEAGLATLNAVNDAEAAVVEAEIRLAQSVYDYNAANADFCQAIGKDYVSIDDLIEGEEK
jgi:outer membrane protein TolC